MIITCTSCLTKFHLDDSRIRAMEVKVRCSRCRHVFTFVPPPETKEKIKKDLESFSKYHEELMKEEKEEPLPPLQEKKTERTQEVERVHETEEPPLFFPEVTPRRVEVEKGVPAGEETEKRARFETIRTARREKKGFPLFLRVGIILILLIVGAFYLWAELEPGARLAPYVEYPLRQIKTLWGQILGSEKEGLTVKGLNGYEEKTPSGDFFVIEGKVHNQSRFTKEFVKVRVVIFDQNRAKIGEKQATCGRVLGRGEWKHLSPGLLEEEMIKPLSEGEAVLLPGKTAPFMVIFRNLPSQPKEFEVEIVAAPNV